MVRSPFRLSLAVAMAATVLGCGACAGARRPAPRAPEPVEQTRSEQQPRQRREEPPPPKLIAPPPAYGNKIVLAGVPPETSVD